MNKFFKITVVAAVTFTAAGVFAAPPKHHHDDNKGLHLATDIVRLVDSCVRLLTGTPQTVVVNQPAAVVATTVPAVTTTIQTPVIVAPPPPPVQQVYINNTVTHRPLVIKQQVRRNPPRVYHKPAQKHKPNRRR